MLGEMHDWSWNHDENKNSFIISFIIIGMTDHIRIQDQDIMNLEKSDT